ncbi:MAG: cupredoxin domain-containing protein [Acidimicrobiales bacterium]|nr:cupredoxin domain-containing protein [Acidimicrobiales bacterium]
MRTRALALIAVLLFVLAACGSGEEATPTVGADEATPSAPADGPDLSDKEFDDLTGESTVEVQARDNNFVPPYIEISAGTEVDFSNRGRNQHNVLPVEDGAFKALETEDFQPGTSDAVTFSEPGVYPYYCSLHGTTTKGMVGAIRVLE